MKGTTVFIWSVFLFISLGLSYVFNYTKSEDELYLQVDCLLQEHAPKWGEYIMQSKGIPHWGRYNSKEYAKKQKTTIMSADDTIEISKTFFHPESYYEYQMKIKETALIMGDEYDIEIIDSLFKDILRNAGVIAESSVELKIRNLKDMFPCLDSICKNAPFVKSLSTESIDGHVSQPIGVGICDHTLLYGYTKITPSIIISNIDWFGYSQICVIILFAILLILKHYLLKYYSVYSLFKKNVVLIGNTCIDLSSHELFLWNGECKHITGTKMQFLQMLIDAAPTYKLSKDDVCRKIWNRNSKDGQALYNVIMTEMRGLLITDDPSLELKSIPKEGMQLLVNGTMINKRRKMHFLLLYLKHNIKKKQIAT